MKLYHWEVAIDLKANDKNSNIQRFAISNGYNLSHNKAQILTRENRKSLFQMIRIFYRIKHPLLRLGGKDYDNRKRSYVIMFQEEFEEGEYDEQNTIYANIKGFHVTESLEASVVWWPFRMFHIFKIPRYSPKKYSFHWKQQTDYITKMKYIGCHYSDGFAFIDGFDYRDTSLLNYLNIENNRLELNKNLYINLTNLTAHGADNFNFQRRVGYGLTSIDHPR